MDALRNVLSEVLGTSAWEALGVILALLYLVLATARSLWCWLCAFISSIIYVVLMARAGLVMDTLLSIYYVIMAIYGYVQWRNARAPQGELVAVSWSWQQHLIAVAVVVSATIVSAWALKYLAAYLININNQFGWLFAILGGVRSPWLDSFVTWGSVLCTWMVARRVLENWLYWIAVDGVAAYLYYTRGLVATSGLMLVYVGMVIYGYFVWRRKSLPMNQPVEAVA